jgi:4-amino-4-deoxy-L-arabinose transferase-like glycosyltransferase
VIGERIPREAVPDARPAITLRAWLLARQRQHAALFELVIVAGIALATFGLRAVSVAHAFEIHVDEAIYVRISQNVAHSLRLNYDLNGSGPFFLHPPLYFLIEAGYLRAFAPSGDVVHQIVAVRYLAAFFGGLSGAAIFMLARRVAGWPAGLVAAGVFAIEPFAIRMDSRNFLEPAAMFWVLVGATLVAAAVRVRGRRRRDVPWSMPAAGAAFGAALLTNEPAAFVTLLPLGLCALFGLVRRRDAALAGGVALALYSVYPLVVAASGNFDDFKAQKLAGVGRFAGIMVVTGFNGAAGPSFLHAVLAKWDEFAPTYGLLALGTVATVWLMFQEHRRGRLVALWSSSAYALQTYSVLFGTNEEQYFYYVDVMAIVAVVTAGTLVVLAVRTGYNRRRLHVLTPPRWLPMVPAARPMVTAQAWSRRATWAAAAIALLLLAFGALSGEVFIHRSLTPDDGYARALVYLADNVPRGSRFAATNATDATLLRQAGYHVTDLSLATQDSARPKVVSDPSVITEGRPEYATVATRLVDEGYGIGTPQVVDWLNRNGEVVFSEKTPSNGRLIVYRIEPGATP